MIISGGSSQESRRDEVFVVGNQPKCVAVVNELWLFIISYGSINLAPRRGFSKRRVTTQPSPFARLMLALVVVLVGFGSSLAQNPAPNTDAPKKANSRPADSAKPGAEPFDGASIEKMAGQCVTLETEQGSIVIEMLPAGAPETVRNFLNLAATGALDTTTFSRTVKDFVIQGGNLATSENWSADLAKRMARTIPDEPNNIKHVRGVVSMARAEEPNTTTTHFFILVGDGPHLDGKFAAFGRVTAGMTVADAINRAPSEGEKPLVPVRIKHAAVAQCAK